jgi:hypothetical protein
MASDRSATRSPSPSLWPVSLDCPRTSSTSKEAP